MSCMLLCCLDEIGSRGACYKESEFLKSTITKKYRRKQKKNIDAEQVKDWTRYMLFSNNNWIVRVETAYDRRFFCLDCNNEYANNIKYFDNLYKYFTKESGEHVFHYLINEIDITGWKWHKIPLSQWKLELIMNNLNPINKTLAEFIKKHNKSDCDKWHTR